MTRNPFFNFIFFNFQGDTTIRFIKIKVKQDIFTDSAEIFSQEIKKGNLSLLISHHYFFAGREAVRMNKNLYLKEIYKEEPVYYLRFPDNRIVEFKRFSRKNLCASIPDKKDLIRKYLKESISGKIITDQEILDFVLFLSSFAY